MENKIDDLEKMMGLLDRIIASKDPEIKAAFEELLIIVTLKQEKDVFGPLRKLIVDYNLLKDRLSKIESELLNLRGIRRERYLYPDFATNPYDSARYKVYLTELENEMKSASIKDMKGII